MSEAILDLATAAVVRHGVRSLRADLALVRAGRALAALAGMDGVLPAHVDPTVAYHERMFVVDGHTVVDEWPVDLRGW